MSKSIQTLEKVNDIDFSNLSGNQITTLVGELDDSQLQSYIKAIDEIKNINFEKINFVPDVDFVDFDTERVKMYADCIKDVDAKQSALLLSTQGLTNAEIQQVLAQKDLTKEKQYQALSDAGLLKTTQKLTLAEIQETLQSKLGSKAKAEEVMKSMGLSVAMEGEENQTVELTAKKLQLAVASGKVTQAEALELATHLGVDKALDAQNKTSLPQWLANLKSTGSALKTQAKDTIAWAKALPLATKALAGVGIGIGAALIAYNAYKNHLEEVRQATEQSATAYKESASSIDDYVSRYQDLQKALQDAKGNEEQTATVKQQLLDLQTELNSKFGEEAKAINLVTGEYEKQIEAIRTLNKEEANKFLNENRKGIATATKKMEKDKTYSLSYGTVSAYTDEGKALQDIASSYADKGMVVNTDESTGMMTVTLTADAQTAYDTINDFETDLRNKAKDLGNEKLFDSVFTVSSDALNNAKSVVDKYGEIYNQALMAELVTDDDLSATYNEALNAVEAYNEALVTGENVAEAKKNLDDVKAKIEGNSETWGKYASITEDLFAQAGTDISNYADTVTDTMGKVEESTKFTKTEMIDTINSMADGFDVLDDIYADVLDGGTFDFTKLDTSKFSEAFSEITPEYEKFIETVSSSPTDIDACQGAFNDLVSAFIDSKGILSGLTEENKDLTISMLQNMGVANAEEIVMAQLAIQTEALALQEQFATEKGYELAEATYAEALEFINEAECSAVAKQELAELALEKIHVNEQTIDTSADIENVIALANAANASALAISKLKSAQTVMSSYESGGLKSGAISMMDVREAQKVIDSIENGSFNYDYQPLKASDYLVTSNSKYTPKYSGADQTASAIEKANKSASDSAKDATEEAKKAYSDWFDFMDVRVEKLDDAFTNLEKGMENVVGAFAKNQLVDAQLGIVDEEINNYTDALAMYKQQAQNVLSTIEDADLRDKIVNGAVELSQIQGENADVVKSAMEAYQNWSGKIAECNHKLEELRTQIRQLELAKFENIIEDYTNQFDLYGDSIDLIKGQIGLLEEAGELIGDSYYTKQIEQSEKQLATLEAQKSAMIEQMTDAISSGRIQKGTDEWIEMQSELANVEKSILDCKTSIEEFNNSLLEIQWTVFERIQTEFGNLHSEMENFVGLFDDFNEIKVSDGKGTWTKEAIATLGLYAQQYELARYQVSQYSDAIEKLTEDYKSGKYSATEYMDKMADLQSGMWDAVNSAESLEDAIIDLNQTRIDEEIETIEDEIDAYEKLIDTQLELTDETEELRKKREDLAEKSKSVTDIEKQLASMQNDDSQATIAKRKLLEEELANAKKDLENAEHEYSVESQKSALEQQLQDYTDARNAEIEALRLSLENRELLISQSFETVKANSSTVGEQIALIAQQHGVTVSDAIITSWANGETAIASYGETLSAQSSAFIGNIMGVESEVYNLQMQADNSSIALANMFATRADNLVGQLQASYMAEGNLNYATGVLQNSLVNTLERGYNISGITSAMGSIVSGMSSVENSARRAAQAIQEALGAQASWADSRTTIQTSIGKNGTTYGIRDIDTGQIYESYGDYNVAYDKWKKVYGYAKGGIVSKENKGMFDPIAKALGEDTMVAVKYDEAILTPKQTSMLQNLASVAPDIEQMWNVPNYSVQTPVMQRNERPNVTINYDSMLHVDNFTDAPHLIGAIESTSKKVTTKILNDINRDFRIHSR